MYGPSFEQIFISLNQDCFVPSLVISFHIEILQFKTAVEGAVVGSREILDP